MGAGRYSLQTYTNVSGITTASTAQVLIGPVDISDYETLSFGFQNQQTAAIIHAIHMQVAYDPNSNASGASGAPNWTDIATAVVPWPSSIAASAIVVTGPLTNAYRWIRILGGTTATEATDRRIKFWVGGHTHQG